MAVDELEKGPEGGKHGSMDLGTYSRARALRSIGFTFLLSTRHSFTALLGDEHLLPP
jgi:hypothetical protein